MHKMRCLALWIPPLILACLAAEVRSAPPASRPAILWHPDRQRMDGNMEGLSLPGALGKLSAATGWRVFLEANTKAEVSAKFKDVTAGEALKLMLGNLSFAIVSQTNGPSKLIVYRTAASLATNMIAAEMRAGPKKGGVITNELVIQLKAGTTKAAAQRLAETLHATVLGELGSLNAYRLQFADETSAQAARQVLQGTSDVASVGSNYTLDQPVLPDTAAAAPANPFNLKTQSPADNGKIVVGLVDMPVQSLNPAMQPFLLPSVSVAGPDPNVNGDVTPTHGTAMAELLLQQLGVSSASSGASSVRVLPVDIYGGSETTTSFDVAAGIAAAVNNGANVINLSLGGDGDSSILHAEIQQAHAQGVEFFAAAGNAPVTTPTYPAAYSEVVSVTAVQADGAPASYANRGSFVQVGAPGTGLVAYDNNAWMVSGTSTSTALMTGAFAAAAAANPGMSFADLQAKMVAQFAFKPPAGP